MNMKYLLFEWKLISRSRRLKQLMVPLICFVLYFYLIVNPFHSLSGIFIFRLFFLYALISIPGATYSQFIFSAEASFMDKLMISPVSIYAVLKAKYRLYCCFAFVIMIIIFPSILFTVSLIEILSSFIFTIGFMYFVCFQCARFNFKRLNIKATKYYNWQGMTINQQIISFIAIFGSGGVIFIIDKLFGENITLLIMSITGLCLILTNKFWLSSISRNFAKTRYHRLECFRE
jgi:hypothetical protein